jgi:DNA-binding response OmpR family regulator
MGARILIAEDEPSIVASLEFLMRRAGFEARVASDGPAALAAIAAFRPQVVILDIMLPLKSGLEVCQAIRADEHCRGTKVLMLTARGGVEEVTRGLAAGADDYLIKPFSTQDLVARVKALLADPVPGSKVAGEGGT